MKNLLKSLAAFQNEVPTIHEETKGYNYTYSNLNTIFKIIKPLLNKHGLGFTQLLNGTKLKTIIFHIDSGEMLESEAEIPQDVKLNSMNTFQVMGSAITYYRRYSLSAALGLITDKDIDAKGDEVKEVKKKVFTLADIDRAITSGKQKEALKLIESGEYTATNELIEKLKK